MLFIFVISSHSKLAHLYYLKLSFLVCYFSFNLLHKHKSAICHSLTYILFKYITVYLNYINRKSEREYIEYFLVFINYGVESFLTYD